MMRSIQPYRRRTSASFWLALLLILMLAGGGIVGVLLVLGVNLNPFAAPREDPYMVRIPINSRPIPAYERVTREHLLNPATGRLMYQPVPPEATVGMSLVGIGSDGSHVEGQVAAVRNDNDTVVFITADGREVPQAQAIELGGAVMNVNAIIGRVVRKDKTAGLGFRETTFFPQGTPEGIAGATPPGMRAVTLDATRLKGVHALNAGDRIDLMASVPVGEVGSFQAQPGSRLPGAALVAAGGTDRREAKATEPMLLAQNAVVLKPVYIRNEATTSASLTQGTRLQNVPKYEVAIAVDPEDVIPLQSALSKNLELTCIGHSMQSDAEQQPAAISLGHSELLAPVTVRPIAAYDVVSREAFISPATRRLRMEPVNRQQVDRLGIVLSVEEALGSVARHDIPAGRFLRRRDLLNGSLRETPASGDKSAHLRSSSETAGRLQLASHKPATAPSVKRVSQTQPAEGGASVVGDRPAITSFVPPGRFAIPVPWNLLYGAEHLQIDDRVDVLATYQLERKLTYREISDDKTREFQRYDLRDTKRTVAESLDHRGEPWIIATDAIVVGPVGFPAPAAAQRAIGDVPQGAQAAERSLTGPAILLAVDNRDVESLIAALNTEDVLFAVAFHSQSSDEVPVGYKRIAVAPVEIPVFELFSDLNWKGLRRTITTRLVPIDDPQFTNAIGASEISQYFGRVLKTGKLRFEHFTAEDFLAAEVEPGVAAGIGGATVAVTVMASQVEGLGLFEDNDRVALIHAGNLEQPQAQLVYHGILRPGPAAVVVVPSARIVRSSSDTSEVVTLEVPTRHATALQAALHSATRLVAVARPRGGAPGSSEDAKPQAFLRDHRPIKDAPKFEAIVGRRSELHVFEDEGRTP